MLTSYNLMMPTSSLPNSVRIGVFPALRPDAGGIFQYSEALLRSIMLSFGEEANERVRLCVRPGDSSAVAKLEEAGWTTLLLGSDAGPGLQFLRRGISTLRLESGARALRMWLRSRRLSRSMAVQPRPDLGRALGVEGIGVCLFAAPDHLAFESGIPAMMAVHDLQHRVHPEFPEVGSSSERAIREYIYRNAARAKNVVVLVDSEIGAQDFLSNYAEFGATPERVKVLPFLPSPRIAGKTSREDVTEARQRFGLQNDYFFYPARFWPHKNHLRVVKAIVLLKKRGIEVDVVFAGGTGGQFTARTYRELHRFVKRCGLERAVRFLGYVPDQDMAPIYSGAKGLIMPTFFGPTNIPIIEAWNLNLPVVTSDIRGIREQVADAAVLVDPTSTRSIADGMEAVLNDPKLRQRLISAGRARVAAYPPEAHARRLREIVDEAITDLV